MRNKIVEKLANYYKEYGVTEEQVTEMIRAGIDTGIRYELVLYNVLCQLEDEYGIGVDPVRILDELAGVTADELLEMMK